MELLPSSNKGIRLAQLFPYRWSHLEADVTESKPRWRTTRKYPIRPRALWQRWLDPSQLIGVRFGSKTSYGLIDVDSVSCHFNQLPDLQLALETIGLCRSFIIRSSSSGGIHIYIPLPESVSTFSLAVALRHCLESHGFPVAAGQLEIFPNVKRFGQSWAGEFVEYAGHRLPLQPGTGSCLLSCDGRQPEGDSLDEFFSRWDNCAAGQDMELLRRALAQGRQLHSKRNRRAAAGPVEKWRADLEADIGAGWSGPGQTNALLGAIASFGRVFEGLEGEALARFTLNTATACPGFEQHCSHRHDIERRCRAWAVAAEKYYWPLGSEPSRAAERYSVNDDRASDAIARIRAAAAQLRLNPPPSVRAWVQSLCELAHCSAQTLYKHLELWHPDRCVTPLYEGVSADPSELAAVQAAIAEMYAGWGVTHPYRSNEVCNPEAPQKNSPPVGGGEGLRGGKGD